MEFSSYLPENQASFQNALTAALIRVQEFLKNTKYTVSQINGSRILEVKKFFNLEEPEKGSEIFVSRIPQLIFEDELVPLFSSVGIVYRMRLMLCFSGANKGFCYVQYINPQLASSAVEKLNGYEIREKKYLSVKKSIDNCRLFFGNIPKEIDKEIIEVTLNSVLKDVNKYFIYYDDKDTTKNRGFVFVEFKTHRSAAVTRRQYSKGLVLWGNNINVDWAIPEEELDNTQLLDVTSLFLRCITPGVTEREIKAKIRHCLPQRTHFKVTKIRDFAFIHFDDHESAELGLRYLKDAEIKDYKFNIVWAHPSKLKKKKSNNTEKNHSSNICSLLSPNQLMKKDRSNEFNNTHRLIYNDINGNSSSSNGCLPGCLDCATFPQNSRSYIETDINTKSLLDRNFFSERNHSTLQELTHPVASEFTRRPIWPIYIQSQVPENNSYNMAIQLLQICNFRLYEAFTLFARQIGWGEITCEITPKIQNGNTVYISKIHIEEAPTDIQSALMSLVKPFSAATEDAAREASAYNIWKLILPHLQIPLFSQYIY